MRRKEEAERIRQGQQQGGSCLEQTDLLLLWQAEVREMTGVEEEGRRPTGGDRLPPPAWLCHYLTRSPPPAKPATELVADTRGGEGRNKCVPLPSPSL